MKIIRNVFIQIEYVSIFKCNLDVTRFVFTAFKFPIFPVLAESRAGRWTGAPHPLLTQ